MRVVINIKRPVNPTGISFVKTVYAQLKAQGIQIDKELSKSITRLGYKLEEIVGEGVFITGKFEIDFEKEEVTILDLRAWEEQAILLPADKTRLSF
jgi:hypothetical protein